MWKFLKHPNIVPLLGVTIAPLQLISSWMSSGNLLTYIQRNPDADRLCLVGVYPVVSTPLSFPSKDIRRRQGPLLPPRSQRNSWGPQRST